MKLFKRIKKCRGFVNEIPSSTINLKWLQLHVNTLSWGEWLLIPDTLKNPQLLHNLEYIHEDLEFFISKYYIRGSVVTYKDLIKTIRSDKEFLTFNDKLALISEAKDTFRLNLLSYIFI